MRMMILVWLRTGGGGLVCFYVHRWRVVGDDETDYAQYLTVYFGSLTTVFGNFWCWNWRLQFAAKCLDGENQTKILAPWITYSVGSLQVLIVSFGPENWKKNQWLLDGNICRCFCCVMNVWHVWGNSNCQSRQIKDGKFDIVSIFADKTSHYFRYIHNEVRHTTIIKYIETKTGTRTTCEGTTPCHWFFSVYFVSNIIIGTLQRAICETDEAGSLQMLEPDFKVSWENLCCLDLNHLSARASSSIPFASHQTPTS